MRDFLPGSLDIADFGLYSQFTLCAHFSSYTSDLRGENRQLVNHIIDSIDQVQNLSRDLHTDDLLGQVTSRNGGLADQLFTRRC